MRYFGKLIMGLILSLTTLTMAASDAGKKILQAENALQEQGEFKKAESLLSKSAEDKQLSEADRKQFAHEIDLLGRIRQDFSLTEEMLFNVLSKNVDKLTRSEFNGWLKEGRFEERMIDGVRMFAGTSMSNLFFRYQELNPRRIKPRDISYYSDVWKNAQMVEAVAARTGSPYVMPTHFKMTMTVKVDADAVPAGKTIRAWLPVPRKYPFQDSFKLVNSSSPVKYLADETNSIRSAYFEQPAVAGKSTDFKIVYEYDRRAVRFQLNPAEIQPFDPEDPTVKQFTREAPHVVFTDKIKALATQIVGPETNELKQARAIYDWIGSNLKYSYSLEYSTIPNISDYVIGKNFGDCGQQAMTFITLCRASGIPARWQTGWFIFPGHQNIHDWTEIYLPPYGWVPVDAEFGNSILRYATNLTPEQRQQAHDFYFGGLDQYRMIANSDHSQPLQPPKNSSRSDDVDFQRGEVEFDNTNIYFDKYDYKMEIEVITTPSN